MKKWKKRILATTLVGGGALTGLGAGGYAYLTHANYEPDLPLIRTLLHEQTEADTVIAMAKQLHAAINTNDVTIDQGLGTAQARLPYAVSQEIPAEIKALQKGAAQAFAGKTEIQTAQGAFRIAAKDDPVYKLVESIVARYNEKHPGAQSGMPQFIMSGAELAQKAAYMPAIDALAVGDAVMALREDERDAIIAHEVRHRVQALSKVPNTLNTAFYYSPAHHAKAMGINLAESCKGISREDMAYALPYIHDSHFPRLAASLAPDPMVQMTFLRGAELAQWIKHPLGMLAVDGKIADKPACAADIKRLKDTRVSALVATALNRDALGQRSEIDADLAAAATVSPEAMANGLDRISRFETDNAALRSYATHPVDSVRLRALGCERVPTPAPDGKQGFTARCAKRDDKPRMI